MGMATAAEEAANTVSACPRCGNEHTVYKCECEAPGRINPVRMPREVAERLRELHRKTFPPMRLTATPNCTKGPGYPGAVTVWVEPGVLWLSPANPTTNDESSDPDNWARLTEADWAAVKDTVDKYFAAVQGALWRSRDQRLSSSQTADASEPNRDQQEPTT